MKWYSISWFGGFKTECEECHHYAVGNNELEARAVMRARITDYGCPHCQTCGAQYQIILKDEPELSLKIELAKAYKEINKLKTSVDSWKDAWYKNRDIIGWLWWFHPAIDNDQKRVYYQEAQASMKNGK